MDPEGAFSGPARSPAGAGGKGLAPSGQWPDRKQVSGVQFPSGGHNAQVRRGVLLMRPGSPSAGSATWFARSGGFHCMGVGGSRGTPPPPVGRLRAVHWWLRPGARHGVPALPVGWSPAASAGVYGLHPRDHLPLARPALHLARQEGTQPLRTHPPGSSFSRACTCFLRPTLGLNARAFLKCETALALCPEASAISPRYL